MRRQIFCNVSRVEKCHKSNSKHCVFDIYRSLSTRERRDMARFARYTLQNAADGHFWVTILLLFRTLLRLAACFKFNTLCIHSQYTPPYLKFGLVHQTRLFLMQCIERMTNAVGGVS